MVADEGGAGEFEDEEEEEEEEVPMARGATPMLGSPVSGPSMFRTEE